MLPPGVGADKRGEAAIGDGGAAVGALASGTNSAAPRLKVLFVSPSLELRESTVATLREAGHRVSSASGEAGARGGGVREFEGQW